MVVSEVGMRLSRWISAVYRVNVTAIHKRNSQTRSQSVGRDSECCVVVLFGTKVGCGRIVCIVRGVDYGGGRTEGCGDRKRKKM